MSGDQCISYIAIPKSGFSYKRAPECVICLVGITILIFEGFTLSIKRQCLSYLNAKAQGSSVYFKSWGVVALAK